MSTKCCEPKVLQNIVKRVVKSDYKLLDAKSKVPRTEPNNTLVLVTLCGQFMLPLSTLPPTADQSRLDIAD